MFKIRLNNIVVFLAIYTTINIKDINALPLQSTSSLAKIHVNAHSGGLNIPTGESNRTSLDFKNVIRSEIMSILKDCNMGTSSSTVENSEDEWAIIPRSGKSGYTNVASKLDDIFQKFKSIENKLRDFQDENNKMSASIEQKIIDLKEANSLGVHCSSCSKMPKNQTHYPKNCKEVQQNGNHVTGIYEIHPTHSKDPFPVLCDMDIRGGGWIHIQKRFDGAQDFFLEWRDYKFGFGDLEGEFWLGLQKIYLLTGLTSMELLVEIVDRNNVNAYAHYTVFGIGPEPEGYALERLSGYSGDAGDSLAYHKGQKFSTKDLDFSGCANRFGNNRTGIYEIYPQHAQAPFPVLCDMDIRGGGWTIIQKRFDGSQDFFLEWRNYKFGFGSLEGEFWLGLEKIYLLTGFVATELLVEIVTRNNEYGYAHYSSFAIGPEPGGYKLGSLSGYSGDIGDSLTYHLGSKFSTKDLDFTNKSCATIYPGGWWYNGCLWSNLNGKHINIDLRPKYLHKGLQWYTFKEGKHGNSHSKSRMLVRSIN